MDIVSIDIIVFDALNEQAKIDLHDLWGCWRPSIFKLKGDFFLLHHPVCTFVRNLLFKG